MKEFFRPRWSPNEMPFLEHLEELRWRIFWSLGVLLVGVIIGYLVVTKFGVLQLLILPIEPLLEGEKLFFLGSFATFFITLKLALLVGLLLSASLLTPGDILSTLFLLGPLYLLYEVSIGLARVVDRRREQGTAGGRAQTGA